MLSRKMPGFGFSNVLSDTPIGLLLYQTARIRSSSGTCRPAGPCEALHPSVVWTFLGVVFLSTGRWWVRRRELFMWPTRPRWPGHFLAWVLIQEPCDIRPYGFCSHVRATEPGMPRGRGPGRVGWIGL